eukprot:1014247-Alexandrium_andersonii.AAC.1
MCIRDSARTPRARVGPSESRTSCRGPGGGEVPEVGGGPRGCPAGRAHEHEVVLPRGDAVQ